MLRKKLINILLVITIAFCLIPTAVYSAQSTAYTDMPDDWSAAAMESAVMNGLLSGHDGKILPKDNLTREQMAALMSRAFGMELSNADDPQENITREEVFSTLSQLLRLACKNEDALNRFADKAQLSPWAEEATAALVDAGYVHGSGGRLNPKQYITRAETAKLMDNIIKCYIKEEGTYASDIRGSVMVNVPGVILKNMEITGDLIIGDGVGDGDVTLDNVTVTGRTLIRGGGVNSIRIMGNSDIQNIVIARVNGQVRVYAEDGLELGEIIVDGNDDVVIEGNTGTVTVAASNVTVNVTGARIASGIIEGDNSKIIIASNSTIQEAEINGKDAEVIIMRGAEIDSINVNGTGAAINGEGWIGEVKANADGITVTTPGARVTAAPDVSGIKAGTITVVPGATVIVPVGNTGSSGGGGGSDRDREDDDQDDEDEDQDNDDEEDDDQDDEDEDQDNDDEDDDDQDDEDEDQDNDDEDEDDQDDEDSDDEDEEPVSIAVTAITVTSDGGTASVANGETLQLYAEVSPANATDKSVVWSVESVDGGTADIDSSGLITATSVGAVRVTASNPASGVIGTKDIEVTAGETAPTPEEYFEFDSDTGTITDYHTEGGLDVVIPDMIGGVTVTHIGMLAFLPDDSGKGDFTNQLTSVAIPETVESIGDYAFAYNYLALINIPSSVTHIGEGAFIQNQLTEVNISSGLTSIGTDVFKDCTELTSINVDPDNSSYSSHEGVLYNKEQTTLLLCPYRKAGSYTIPDTVTSIADSAFRDCTELTEVNTPESLNNIGDFSFYNCGALTYISIPESVTSIGVAAFSECIGLTEISIPDGVPSIGSGTFSYCTELTSVVIPESVTSIGEYAFANCQSLTGIALPDSITSIGDYAFVDCSELSDINIPNGLTIINSYILSGCRITSITIPENVTSIGYAAFSYCYELSEITIPNDVEIIGNYTFIDVAKTSNFKTAYANEGAGTYTRSGDVWTKESLIGASINTVSANNGTITITLADKPSEAPVAEDFTATIRIEVYEETELTEELELEDFTYDGGTTVTFTFTPVEVEDDVQTVFIAVAIGEADPVEAESFKVGLRK